MSVVIAINIRLDKMPKLTKMHIMAELEKKIHVPVRPVCRYSNTSQGLCWHELYHTCFVEQKTPVERRNTQFL